MCSSPCLAPNMQSSPYCMLRAPRAPAASCLPVLCTSHHTICPPFGSRQGASAFNQPLSFETSSVTNMGRMFQVRSHPRCLRRFCSRALPCTLRASRSPAASRLPARTSFRTVCPPFDPRQRASAFNQQLSFDTSGVMDMNRMFNVRPSLCTASNVQSILPLHIRSPFAGPRPHPTPYALIATLGSTRRRSTSS